MLHLRTWFSTESSHRSLVQLHLLDRQVSDLLSPGQVCTNTRVALSSTNAGAHTLEAASLEPPAVLPVVLVLLLLLGEAAAAFPTAHLRTLLPGGEAHHRSPSRKSLHQGLAAEP